MTMGQERRGCVVLLAGLVLGLAACQPVTFEKVSAETTENRLVQAGFQRLDAETPERLAQIAAMRQRILVGRDQSGQTRWVYADAKGCGCLYLGGERAYRAYAQVEAGEEKADLAEAARSVDVADERMPQPDGDAPKSWDDVPWYDTLQY